MTSKDFVKLAYILSTLSEDSIKKNGKRYVVRKIADQLKMDYPNFKPTKFMEACHAVDLD